MDAERELEPGTPQEPTETAEEAGIEVEAPEDGRPVEGEVPSKKVTIPLDEYIALKVKQEQANAERAARESQPTTTDTGDSEAQAQRARADEMRAQLVEDERYLAEIEAAAESGNREARAALALHRRGVANARAALEAEERTVYRLEMFEIDKEERAEVQAFMRQQGIKSPSVARQFMRGGSKFETQAQENARLRAEIEELKKPKPRVEPTAIRGAAKASVERKANGVRPITLEQYGRDMNDPAKARELIALRKAGKLDIQV